MSYPHPNNPHIIMMDVPNRNPSAIDKSPTPTVTKYSSVGCYPVATTWCA